MPFPLVTCETTEVPEGCCTAVFDQGMALINAVYTQLQDCIVPHPCCARTLRYYISLGPPETWQTDLLVAYVEPPGLTFSPGSFGNSGMFQGPPMTRMLWRIYLIESGYPPPRETPNGLLMPTDDELHIANQHAYAHGEAMLRGVINDPAIRRCGGLAIRDMTFVGPTVSPEMWSAGWSLGVTLDVKL